jgi:hypothetical protein
MVRPLVVDLPKLTMQFNGGTNGWTESHFYTSPVSLDNLGLQAAALLLCKKRCACLDGKNAYLFGARLSIDSVNRDSSPVDISTIYQDPVHGYVSLQGPDPSQTSIWSYQTVQVSWTVRLKTSSPTTNPIEYIAGMPAQNTQNGPFPYDSTPPRPGQYLSVYFKELTGSVWGALGRDWTSALYQIGNIAYNPAGGQNPANFAITFSLPYPVEGIFPAGAYCRMESTTYKSAQTRLRLNGTYTVGSYNATTGVLVVNCPRVIVAPTFLALGTMQSADGAVFQYTDYFFGEITHRKRGRPFGGGRGRR